MPINTCSSLQIDPSKPTEPPWILGLECIWGNDFSIKEKKCYTAYGNGCARRKAVKAEHIKSKCYFIPTLIYKISQHN